jgi:radical SAM protein with 4Fe4S-binding SPASM domain
VQFQNWCKCTDLLTKNLENGKKLDFARERYMMLKIRKYGRMKIVNIVRLGLMRKPELMVLWWECTKKCNLKCKHCFANAGEGNYQDELTTTEIKDELRKIAERYKAEKISFSVSGGEPLMRKDLFEVMTYAKELGYKWGLATNGTLIDKGVIENMKAAGLSTITISLDGKRETHDNFRGIPGSFNKVLESVRLLKQADFLKVIQITTVFNRQNLDEMRDMYEIVKNSGADSWQVLGVEPLGRANQNNDLVLKPADYKILFDFIKEVRKEQKIKVTYEHSHFLGNDYEFEVRNGCFICLTGITIAGILHNGDVFICPFAPRLPHLIQGSIRERDFCDIWENEFRMFRDENRTSNDKCQKCENWKVCYGGALHSWDFENNQQKVCMEGYLWKNQQKNKSLKPGK